MKRLLFLFLLTLLSVSAQIFPTAAYTPVTASSDGTIHTPASFFTANAPAIATAGFATQSWVNSTFAPIGSSYAGFTFSLNEVTAQGSPIAASLAVPTGYYGLKITGGAGSGYPLWLESQGGQIALKLAQTTTTAADPILRLYRATESVNPAVNLMEVYNSNGILTSGIDGTGHFFPNNTTADAPTNPANFGGLNLSGLFDRTAGFVQAATYARQLATPCTINGVSFDGSSNINSPQGYHTQSSTAYDVDTVLMTISTTTMNIGDGVAGQQKRFICVDGSGTLTISPFTKHGYSAIQLTSIGSSVSLEFVPVTGWVIVGGFAYAITP